MQFAAAVCAWFYGCQILALSDAVVLQFTTPVFAAVFAVFLVGEKWNPLDMFNAVVCLLGVALIAHPTWLFGKEDHYDGSEETNNSHTLGVLVTTVGSILAGLAYVYVRKIGDQASAVQMVLYYGYVSLMVSIVGSKVFEGTWNVLSGGRETPFTAFECVLILLIGILGHSGQWLLNAGLQREKAATGTLATCTQIVWTYIFELSFLHETLDKWSLIGTAFILGDMVVVAAVKMKAVEPPDQSICSDPSERTSLLKANGRIQYDSEAL